LGGLASSRRRRPSSGDRQGVAHFLASFGGMGSLNDVVLRPPADDAHFNELIEEAWNLASRIRRTS
jgi:hypothetical protein